MFHIGWQRVDAKLIDQRFLRRDSYNVNKGGSSYQVWEYMVELPGPDGMPVRLTIEEKTFKLKDPQIGDTVPVLVNRKRTKADFDLKDSRIDGIGALKAREKARKARDEARFESKLRGE
jgi:hypothetical protein